MMGILGKGILGKAAAGAVLAMTILTTPPAWAVGGSFSCERPSIMEVTEHVEGSSALESIVNQYRMRWDAREVEKQCQAYADGQPYEISCMNGRRDWEAILASVPADYFGRSNTSLAATVDMERRAGNGLKEAIAYCRSVGAIK